MSKILVVEDDPLAAETVVELLSSQNHTYEIAEDGAEALSRLKHYWYDLVILDWQLPGLSGLELCRSYRAAGGKTPILMLTGKIDIEQKERGLDSGADDYLTKPYSVRELAARVRALLRRPPQLFNECSYGKLSADRKSLCISYGLQRLDLAPKEFALMEFLIQHPQSYFSAEQLLDHVWDADRNAGVDALRSCIKRLRRHIDKAGWPQMLRSSRAYGYKLDLQDSDSSDQT